MSAASFANLFEVLAADNRHVVLTSERFYGHILSKHPEIGRLKAPLQELETALLHPVAIRPAQEPQRVLYIGPRVQETGFWRDRCLYVYVQRETRKPDWIVTAVLRKAGAEDQ